MVLAYAMAGTIVNVSADVQHLLPKVKKIQVAEQGVLSLSSPFTISDETSTAALRRSLTEMDVTLVNQGGIPVNVEIVKTITGAFRHNLPGYPAEEYTLAITPEGITIRVTEPTGVIRAAQTLVQLAMGREDHTLPCVEITDWPAFKLRGYMHDVGRSFIDIETLRRQIDLLSRFKVNTFHWHLTENQAWRFEVKAYPQLTAASSMTRFPGMYYTQQQCRDLIAYAAERGVTVIPEIDMPGHSAAYQRTMGHGMQTDQGVAELQTIIEEVADVFAQAPYIHIGADEETITYPDFLRIMVDKVHSLGRKVVVWNPIRGVSITKEGGYDMTTMWSTAANKVSGIPNIDLRYNYVNHFDVFADPVGIYRSQIYYANRGSSEVAGAITALWNDRKTLTQEDITAQNNLYVNALVTCERAWVGGGKQYIETGGATLPVSGDEFDEFADWERRFLFYKSTVLDSEPIPYVKQTNIRWRITDPMPNGNNPETVLPPETEETSRSYELDGVTYGTHIAAGAGIYLRHTWGNTVPALFNTHTAGTTSYAYTYVYSPVEQTAGALIEFQNYGRSEKDKAPDLGKWDRKGSDIMLNDARIEPPVWTNAGKSIDNETPLGNENFAARKPIPVTLRQGWNKVLVKLPYGPADGVRLNKWMFTFVLTDTEGKNALDGLIYSPDRIMDAEADKLNMAIDEAQAWRDNHFKNLPGYYSPALAADFDKVVDELKATLEQTLDAGTRSAQIQQLQQARQALEHAAADAKIVQPLISDDNSRTIYYFTTPNRDNRYLTGKGTGQGVKGEGTASAAAGWIFADRGDGTLDIVNYNDGTYLSPSASYNTAIRAVAARPAKGWQISASNTIGLVIITSGSVQLNQTNSGLQYQIYNWGGGTNISDSGCQYSITLAADLNAASIPTVVNDNTATHRGIYDLAGRRLQSESDVSSGFYIVDGVKTLIQH